MLSQEGINGTIFGSEINVDRLMFLLTNQFKICIHRIQYSYTKKIPFRKIKIKIKQEIINMGINNINPKEKSGNYISSSLWNDFVEDPNILLIDVRNDYEYNFGSFLNAINLKIRFFWEFSKWVQNNKKILQKNKKIAMFCTGGIRCEKSTSYLMNIGFNQVYQLEGGIIKYLKNISKKESIWKGKCFVFDDRNFIDHESA